MTIEARRALALAALASATGCGLILGIPSPSLDETVGKDAGPDAAQDAETAEAASDAAPEAGPALLVSGVEVLDLRVDDTSVYWNDGTNFVGRASKFDGTNQMTLVDSQNTNGQVSGLAVDQDSVYFGSVLLADVLVCPKTGCTSPPRDLVDGSSSPGLIALDIDDTNVYWIQLQSSGLYTLPKSASLGTPVLLGTYGSQPTDLRVVGGKAYAALASGGVGVFDLATKTLTKLPSLTQQLSAGVAVSGASVYFTQGSEAGVLGSVLVDGGMLTTLASGLDWPSLVATDGAKAFWIDNGNDAYADSAIVWCALASCAPSPIATQQPKSNAIVIDDSAVYWGNYGTMAQTKDGSIWRAAK